MARFAAFAALYSIALSGLASAAVFDKADYDSGAIHHHIMDIKVAQWDAEIAAGKMDSSQYPELGYTKCVNGFAAAIPGDEKNTFRCNNVRSLTPTTMVLGTDSLFRSTCTTSCRTPPWVARKGRVLPLGAGRLPTVVNLWRLGATSFFSCH